MLFSWHSRGILGRRDPNENSMPYSPASHEGVPSKGTGTCIFLLLLHGQKPVAATVLVFPNATAWQNPRLAAMLTILRDRTITRIAEPAHREVTGPAGQSPAEKWPKRDTFEQVTASAPSDSGPGLGALHSCSPGGCYLQVTLEFSKLARCHLFYGWMFWEIRMKLL